MDAVWWTLFVLAIVFYTLWVAGAFKKRTKPKIEDPQQKL
jgi:hypothetical protein